MDVASSQPFSPDCMLVDHDGRIVRSIHRSDSLTLVVFGFTHCRVVCPRVLGRLMSVLERLGTSACALRPVYVTVDPDRDTPDRLRDYLRSSYPLFTGLTGTAEQLLRVRQSFRVFASRRGLSDTDYDVAHSAVAYLLDARGALVDHWQESVAEDALMVRLSMHIARREQTRGLCP